MLERYYGSWARRRVALVRVDGQGRKLEFAAAPDVEMKQDVEELLFRAYSLWRQVHLTFVTGRDRALSRT